MNKNVRQGKLLTKLQEMSFFKKNILFIVVCFVLLACSTIGYAALNQKLFISGDLALRAVKDIRISNLEFISSNGGSYEIYNNKFTTNSISIFTILPEKGSSVVYRGTITNYGTKNMVIDTISFSTSSKNISYNISNIKEGTVIKGNTSITFDITLTKTATPVSSSEVNSILLEITFKEPDLSYTDATIAGNDPNLLNNSLTPVVYDETKSAWVVADTTKEWYNYSKQEWANAVILNGGVTKNVGDTVVVPTDSSTTSEVKAMLVWIPRFEYHIEGEYGTHLDGTTGTQALPGQIEVKFIPRNKTIADANYVLHPAFTWDDNNDGTITAKENISGIWVGKFETTGTGTEPTVLPNLTSLVKQNVNSQFNTALKLKNYLDNVGTTDSHMMKNSEWGAVAYLSQSIYGKYGNELYTGYYKQVYKNDSSQFYTGRSSGVGSQDSSSASGTCLYNDITDRGTGTGSCGGGASTTGNITGVYDMSGGAYEYVMGYLTTANKSLFGANNKDQNAWTTTPASKYYDAYTNTSPSKACNEGVCYGQALSETSGWSNNAHTFVYSEYPWILRGGSYQASPAPGLFSYDRGVGNQYNYYSFRTVFLMPGEALTGILYGDINEDGKIDEDDYLLLYQHSMMPDTYPISDTAKKAGDLNGDGELNIDDALILKKYIDGEISTIPLTE